MREVVDKHKFHHGVPVSLAFCIPFCPWEANALTMGVLNSTCTYLQVGHRVSGLDKCWKLNIFWTLFLALTIEIKTHSILSHFN